MRVVVVTGGFDPLHSGHIEYFKAARELGDILCVGVNSDDWLTRKKGRPFMTVDERINIVTNLKMVGHAFEFDDSDDTAIKAIEYIKGYFPQNSEIVFANGGDRTSDNIPEMVFDDVEFVFGVGGEDKKNSSSWILKEWSQPTTERNWGRYRNLASNGSWKVKELMFDVGKELSDQKHAKRSEHWHIVDGNIKMVLDHPNGYRTCKIYTAGESIDIPIGTWHKASTMGDEPAHVIEVWMGSELTEDDIERRD